MQKFIKSYYPKNFYKKLIRKSPFKNFKYLIFSNLNNAFTMNMITDNNPTEEAYTMKIMSNEQLVVSYRDAVSSNKDKDLIKYLKAEIQSRGLKPFKNR